MARKAAKAAPKRSKGKTGSARNPQLALREALLRLVAKGGWRRLSYAEIADEAGLGLADALGAYSSKSAILAGLARSIDTAMLESLAKDPLEGSAKDRLFDLLMRRFDRLKTDRQAYVTLARELPSTPVEAMCLVCALRRSMALTLEAAGISASGLSGVAKIEGLGGAYALALRAFFNDESGDLAPTMAELDKRLTQLGRLCSLARCKTSN